MNLLFRQLSLCCLLASALSACGGGGGDDGTAASASQGSSESTASSTASSRASSSTAASSKSSASSSAASSAATSSSSQSSASSTASAKWTPSLTDTWQWQLTGTLNTSYEVKIYDIDLFDNSAATIQALQAAGRKVVCYFSAGSAEDWRSDYSNFLSTDIGNGLDGWEGEYWLDTRSSNVRAIMQARMDLAVSKGCDGVEPDNVDGYANSTGLALTAATQLDYNRFLATEAHARGLAVALKNDVGQLSDLVTSFDFAMNESCHDYSECGAYSVFINASKPVFNVEYDSSYVSSTSARQTLCQDAATRQFRTLVLPQNLDDSFRYSCD